MSIEQEKYFRHKLDLNEIFQLSKDVEVAPEWSWSFRATQYCRIHRLYLVWPRVDPIYRSVINIKNIWSTHHGRQLIYLESLPAWYYYPLLGETPEHSTIVIRIVSTRYFMKLFLRLYRFAMTEAEANYLIDRYAYTFHNVKYNFHGLQHRINHEIEDAVKHPYVTKY